MGRARGKEWEKKKKVGKDLDGEEVEHKEMQGSRERENKLQEET